MTLNDIIAGYPLDFEIREYIEAAEEEGLAWAIAGGPGEPCKVTLFFGPNSLDKMQEFGVEKDDPCVAFYQAFAKYIREKK